MKSSKERPIGKVWESAKLYSVSFNDTRLPVSGGRLAWVKVGRKNVKICIPITNRKFTIKKADWDNLNKVKIIPFKEE